MMRQPSPLGGGLQDVIPWGSPTAGLEVKDQLDAAIDQDRWQRIAAQEGGTGAEQGLDWSAARKLLKKHSKNHLLRSGLRMLWQGAIKRASHGGPDACEVCGEPNTLRHALQECPAWASHDIGPDPAWRVSLPQAPRCLWERGLVPKQLTVHPALPAELLAVQKTGFFLQPDPCKEVYFGTDATGGLKGNDPRLRLVSWAVVAIQPLGGDLPTDPAGELFPKTRFKVVGTMKGALQIGATVNDGECVALDQLACFVGQTASVAVDSKVAAKRCQNPIAERIWPQIWESQASQRARLQVTWTKGHLNEEQHAKRFGVSCNWAWAANLLADDICGKLSACLFSQEQAALTDTCDKVATAVSTWLGKRCAHLLATAKPTKGPKDHPFQELPNKNPSPPKAVGPNKKQRMLAASAVQDPHTGHTWKVTSHTVSNLCMKCSTCGLLAQQKDHAPFLESILAHPCAGREASVPHSAKVHCSHSMTNQGNAWQCTQCHAKLKFRFTTTSACLKSACAGKSVRKKAVTRGGPGDGVPAQQGNIIAAFHAKDRPFSSRNCDCGPNPRPTSGEANPSNRAEVGEGPPFLVTGFSPNLGESFPPMQRGPKPKAKPTKTCPLMQKPLMFK